MIKFLQNNKLSILILTIFVSVYGVFSVINIPKEAMPSINLGYYMVMLTYPGADPSTVEQQAISKLEQKIKSINMVKQISSTSSYNFGIIAIEFYKGKSDVDAVNDIKSAIDQVYPSLPSDVRLPTIRKLDVNDSPIYTFSIAGPYTPEIIYQKTKSLEDTIKSVPGVRELTVIGKPTQEIRIAFDLNKLGELDMEVASVIGMLRGAFIKLPADKKQVSDKLYSFEVTNYAQDLTGLIDQLSNYDIININGKSIKLKDIADVYLTSRKSDKKSFVVMNLAQQTTTNGISFQVSKIPGYDIQELTLNLKNTVNDFIKTNPELKFIETESVEDSINKVYSLFLETFLETGLLVFIIILIFLGGRSSIMILISFLIVYLTNFIYLKAIGYSFNNIVSFSLILVLGIMIDNLIVIAQGIVVGLRKYNNIRDAIQDSIKNYGRAIIFGTSTTIAIFLPLYFGLSGAMGEFMKSMPVTIISNLVISLIITLLSLPILATYFYKPGHVYQTKATLAWLERLGHKFANFFYRTNKSRWGSFVIVILFISFFVSSILLIVKGVVKVDFMGNTDSDNVWINVKYSPGISIVDNQKYTYEISKDIIKYLSTKYSNQIKYLTIDLGSSRNSSNINGANGGSNNLASFNIRLTPTKERNIKSYIIVEDLQNFLTPLKSKYPFLQDISPLTLKSGPSSGKPVGFYIVGDDYVLISKYINQIQPLIEKIPGVFNVDNSIEYTNGRFTYTLDENKIKQYGLSNVSVAMTLMALQNSDYQPNGIKIDEFTEFGDDPIAINALVKYTDNIDTLKIGKIYLNQIIKSKKLGPELLGIEKLDGEKVVLISADKKNEIALSEVTAQINEIIKNNPMPEGLSYKDAADAQAQSDSTRDMGNAMILGILLMYLVLVIQFNNTKYATVIITSVFLTIGGSIYILGAFGMKFGFVAQLGIFGVLGVGVNQALIHLEDFKDYYQKKGYSVRDSFRMSIAERFVPIFLTKATTIVGLIILSYKDEMFGTLALAFIGGLIVSFFVNLIYIPSLMRLTSRDYYNKENQREESDEDEEIISEHEMEYIHVDTEKNLHKKKETKVKNKDSFVSLETLKNKLMDDEDDFLPPEPKIIE